MPSLYRTYTSPDLCINKAQLKANDVAYDMVLMDLQMPEMDGYETTTRLRADSRFLNLPVVALTSHAMMEERQRCLDAGMNDHLTKPLDPDALFAMLLHWCGSQKTGGQAILEPQSSPDACSDVPAIPRLDAEQGFKRVAGNRQLYNKPFAQFLDMQIGAIKRVKELLDTSDAQSACKLTHTLAGAAGNLGAKDFTPRISRTPCAKGRPT